MIVVRERTPDVPTSRLAGISLDGVNDIAALQARIDRKYIIDADVLAMLVDSLSVGAAVMEIGGRRSFGYESVYFDTANLDLYRAAAHRRRRRFKVRTRTYRDTATCVLEVKTKGRRGQVIKSRIAYELDDHDRLTDSARSFIDGTVGVPNASEGLAPMLTTSYTRTTIVDPATRTRMTYDRDLVCTDWTGASVSLVDSVVVETKSPAAPSPVDRRLWSLGIRPVKFSKYCTSLAALHSDLPANRWRRTLSSNFGVISGVDGGERGDHARDPAIHSKLPGTVRNLLGHA